METALHSFLHSVPQAAAIWLVILAVALLAVVTLTLPDRLRATDPDLADLDWADPYPPDPRPAGPASADPHSADPDAADPDAAGAASAGRGAAGRLAVLGRRAVFEWRVKDAARPAADRDWTRRYADEVTVAADRAAVTARRRRAEWERAQQDVDEAWAAFDAADRAARRFAAATAFPVPGGGRPPGELADRERYLHRAATAACRRREISMHELNDMLAHRDGWDPRRHPAGQEVALRRAVRDRCLVTYREATARERQAWRTAEVSAAALSCLREEACAATLRAGQHERTPGELWWAEQWAPEPAPSSSAITVAIPQLVTH